MSHPSTTAPDAADRPGPHRRLDDAAALALAETFKVLGDPTRVRILDAVSQSELCVGDLAAGLGLTESADFTPAPPAAEHAARTRTPRGPDGVLLPRRPAHRRSLRAGAGARAGSPADQGSGTSVADLPVTCTVCELHAESTFKVEGMDCREEVALHRAAVQAPGGPRGVHRRPGRPAPARQVRRGEDHGRQRLPRPWRTPACAPGSSTRSRSSRATPGRVTGALLLGRRALCWPRGSPPGFSVRRRRSPTVLFAALAGRRRPSHRAPRPGSAVRLRSLDINVLMLVAAAGAVVLGEWSEAAAVVFLFAVAQALEARTLERARTAVRALMDLTPAEALVREDNRRAQAAGRPGRARRSHRREAWREASAGRRWS